MLSMAVSKQDWLESGLRTLEKDGLKALTIQQICSKLGVTKGSFYHHFRNVRDYEEQLVAFWANQYLSTSSNIPAEPAERLLLLDTLMEEVFASITGPELAIRTWAQEDEMVFSFVRKVDAARREFALGVLEPFSDDAKEASLMADLLFTLSIGGITAIPRVSPQRHLELYHEFKRLYDL
jgi:AcrR family transcriptional regulator